MKPQLASDVFATILDLTLKNGQSVELVRADLLERFSIQAPVLPLSTPSQHIESEADYEV